MTTKRRHAPCEFCGYPITETHHPYKRSLFGKNKYTIQLCANCHEYYHLAEAMTHGSATAEAAINHMLDCNSEYFGKILIACLHYINQVKENTK